MEQQIYRAIAPEKEQLLSHPLYEKIQTMSDLHRFLENHVYAVWDFMSLLKALQQHLTCTTTPWFATPDPETRYLINEIVLAEESDLALDGRRLSHFEMYLEAMEACGASTSAIKEFIGNVHASGDIFNTIADSDLPTGVQSFLEFTFRVIADGKPHLIAAAFTFGREDLIPSMFTEILRHFEKQMTGIDLRPLIYYFERHIELDADEHGPMAMQMVAKLCGDDAQKWQEAEAVSKEALARRIGLWNAIDQAVMIQSEA